MRVLVISDIHANLAAFEAVLEDASEMWDTIWFLGDLVGYGPDPNECVALLQEHDHISLSGNHDWAVLGKLDLNIFNMQAQASITWTREQLDESALEYLDAQPSTLVCEPFTLAHASPRQPVWEYILDSSTASANLDHFATPYCLVGHTHIPIMFAPDKRTNQLIPYAPVYNAPVHLNANRYILNPGSVGQPRDSDARASYALLDTEEMIWRYRRVAYPVGQTQRRMRDHDMPHHLVERLALGW